ncbi:MAG: hypothetical protein ACO3IM_00305 [Pelagibacteraceae bacterium]|jgi:hypothetical protein
MKKTLYTLISIFIILISIGIFYLSFIGLETSKFNNIISSEIKKKDSAITIELKKILIKFDLKEFQIYLSTSKPLITYQNIDIPIEEVNIYSKIIPLLKSKVEISQANFVIKNFELKQIQIAALRIKPSNFKTYLLNNLKQGKLNELVAIISLNNNYEIIDYKFNGSIEGVDVLLPKSHIVKDLNLNFAADKNLVLLNSINASYNGLKILNGSINLENKDEIFIKGKFDSKFNFNEQDINSFIKNKFFLENKIITKGNLVHNFNLNLDQNYKLIKYDYILNGNIEESKINFNKSLKNQFLKKSIKTIQFTKTKIDAQINNKNENKLILDGSYNADEGDFNKFKIESELNNKKYVVDFDVSENISIDFLNYTSDKNSKINVKSHFNFNNNDTNFKSISIHEGPNSIDINGLSINDKFEIKNLASVSVITFNEKKENNNFKINIKDKIIIGGSRFDATNLLKSINSQSKNNPLVNFTKEIEINLENLVTKSEIPINNFRLIGKIEKGKFINISAKSEFSKDKYLDISLKKDPNNKKILEIYSDVPKALLADYKFFEGLKDGKLFFNSVIDEDGSVSKITIENFKVVKAPAFATLLTLADLGGVADLLSGEGMSFDILEISLNENKDVTKIEEILALGSSISVIMDGYTEKKTGLISLSGTLVPAKTLNSLVSKIPVVGNILVGDKVGEGVFGVSFKMKGLPGDVKTTVNPVKTLTPRFITRALEKMKKN